MLDTDRLYLREQTIKDLDRLYEIYSSSNITRYMEGLYEDYEEEYNYTLAYIKNMYNFYGYGFWLVVRKEDDEIIGRAGLSNREVDGEIKLELGYVIAEEFQNQGYAYEVCKAICEFVKEFLYENEIVCVMKRENIPSIKLAEKLGFTYDTEVTNEGENYCYYRKRI